MPTLRHWLPFVAIATAQCSAFAGEFKQYTPGLNLSSENYKSLIEAVESFRLSTGDDVKINSTINATQFDPRIVGGRITSIDEYPWQAALVFKTLPEPLRALKCGGSIIRSNWILTAAHCVDDATEQDIVSQTSFYKYQGARTSGAKFFIHPGWKPATMENDIALIRIETGIDEKYVVKLAVADERVPDNTDIYVSGWGAIFEGGPTSDVLQVANVPTVSNEVCNADVSYGGRIKANMMCAGFRDGGLDSCQGDSGGPAVAYRDGTPVQVGVVSWGEGCARRLKYGVYTRITPYINWINETINSP
jgi:secreted trypsin-like serine protease